MSNEPWGDYFEKRGVTPVEIEHDEFLKHYYAGDFFLQPMQDTFGDGYGEPYNPNRKAWGVLKDGRGVWCTTGM